MELKDQLLDLRGRAYLPVSARLWGFREEYPITTGWAIRTELIDGGRNQGFAVFRAEVVNPEGVVVAVGHGSRTEETLDKYKKPYKDDKFFEFAETKARGRAMEAAGWGTLAAIDGDEDENSLADAPVPRGARSMEPHESAEAAPPEAQAEGDGRRGRPPQHPPAGAIVTRFCQMESCGIALSDKEVSLCSKLSEALDGKQFCQAHRSQAAAEIAAARKESANA